MAHLLHFVILLCLALLVSAGTTPEGLAFLQENKNKEGVVELPSGLQYKVLKSGSGIYHPSPSTPCLCHYAGTLIDGSTFDSSYDRGEPITFAPNQVIKGWTEAMALMVEGDKWEMYIPSELGYGDSGSPPKIPPGSVLIFQMEILALQGNEAEYTMKLSCDALTGEKCNDKEKGYIEKIGAWDNERKVKEVARLAKVLADPSAIKAEQAKWMKIRAFILDQVTEKPKSEAEEL